MTATSAVSHGAPIPLQQLGELVSRYERPARPKRTEEPAFVDANSNDRETA
uniref:Uncharacterized protein n=1 Tax=Plectus sambesii TaxID=2011161 RepID=A0A914VN45_9BILA